MAIWSMVVEKNNGLEPFQVVCRITSANLTRDAFGSGVYFGVQIFN